MTLAKKMKNARKTQKLTQRDIEETSGVSNVYIGLIENGKALDPHPRILRRLAGSLKLNFLELMILAGHLTVRDLKGKI